MVLGTLLLLPAALAEGLVPAMEHLGGTSAILILFLGILGGAVGYFLWTFALTRLTPTQVKLENFVLTPHTAGFSDLSIAHVCEVIVENIRRLRSGEPLLNVVNYEGVSSGVVACTRSACSRKNVSASTPSAS